MALPADQLLLTVSLLSEAQRYELLHMLMAGAPLVAGSSPFAPVHLLPFGAKAAIQDASPDPETLLAAVSRMTPRQRHQFLARLLADDPLAVAEPPFAPVQLRPLGAAPRYEQPPPGDLVDQLLALPAERQRALLVGLLAACPLEADGNRIALPVQPAGTVSAALLDWPVGTATALAPAPEPEPLPEAALTFHGAGGVFLVALDTTATRLILRTHPDTPDIVRWLDYAAVAPLRVEALRDAAPSAATPSWSGTIRQKSGSVVLLYAHGNVTCYDPEGAGFCTVTADRVIFADADPAARSRLLRTARRV